MRNTEHTDTRRNTEDTDEVQAWSHTAHENR